MGIMKEFDRRIRAGGDDAIAAVSELWESREKILFDITDAFTKARWIPVEERLPEAQVAVLGFCCGEIGVCKRFSCGWYWDEEYSHQAINPTYWMVLPEPPTE